MSFNTSRRAKRRRLWRTSRAASCQRKITKVVQNLQIFLLGPNWEGNTENSELTNKADITRSKEVPHIKRCCEKILNERPLFCGLFHLKILQAISGYFRYTAIANKHQGWAKIIPRRLKSNVGWKCFEASDVESRLKAKVFQQQG